jgi:KUP system potassium uptake protein
LEKHVNLSKLSVAGVFITLGIIFGDIGTSPLYVLKAVLGDRVISKELIFGGISCRFLDAAFDYYIQICSTCTHCR